MEPMMIGILVPLGFAAMIFGIAYLGFTTRNRERMALIERGADPTLFEAKKKVSTGGAMKVGLFFVGIGMGVVMAYLISSGGGMDEGAAYPAMIFIFGGLALILSHLWQRKQEKEDALKV
ncbi:MAG: hypothetical protein NTY07_06450 [Bacteroidia bacterium]|nr:hypothetical protein [Bacteroidia bacterium]